MDLLWLCVMIGLVVTITIPACEGCCQGFCHDLYGDDIDVLIDSVAFCPECGLYLVAPATTRDFSAVFSGGAVNGAWVASWDGIDSWRTTVGTVTVTIYSSTDGTCTDPLESQEVDLNLRIKCTVTDPPGEFFEIRIESGTATLDGLDVFLQIFFAEATLPEADNVLISTGCR